MANSGEKAKAADDLMKHLQDECHIAISGCIEKKQLIQYGYYHGYKGYRFIKKSNNIIPYTKFSEIVAVIEYDNELKEMVYPALMFIETAAKNIVLEQVVPGMRDTSIDSIYLNKMTDEPYNNKLRLKRLRLRDRVHTMLSGCYKNGKDMVIHFYNRGQEVPLWAVFEVLMLGDFANFIICLNRDIRQSIAKELGMDKSYDTNVQMVSNALFVIKSLRNAVAHNNIVFDARFKDCAVNKNLIRWVEQQTEIMKISFEYFTDYLALIICVLKRLDYPEVKMNKLINEYRNSIDKLYKGVSIPIHNKIMTTGIQNKLNKLEEYAKCTHISA